ncbi:MAG: hypothetical protein AAGA54_18815 [Myxococcota bacterium]
MTASLRLHLGICVALLAAAAAVSACAIDNPDHCANQDTPGNDWCGARYSARPFCSPCEAENNGCVQYEPFTCGDYDPDEQNSAPDASE